MISVGFFLFIFSIKSSKQKLELSLLEKHTGISETDPAAQKKSPLMNKDNSIEKSESPKSEKKSKKREKKSSVSEEKPEVTDENSKSEKSPKKKRTRKSSASEGLQNEDSKKKKAFGPLNEDNDSGVEVKGDLDSDAEVQVGKPYIVNGLVIVKVEGINFEL